MPGRDEDGEYVEETEVAGVLSEIQAFGDWETRFYHWFQTGEDTFDNGLLDHHKEFDTGIRPALASALNMGTLEKHFVDDNGWIIGVSLETFAKTVRRAISGRFPKCKDTVRVFFRGSVRDFEGVFGIIKWLEEWCPKDKLPKIKKRGFDKKTEKEKADLKLGVYNTVEKLSKGLVLIDVSSNGVHWTVDVMDFRGDTPKHLRVDSMATGSDGKDVAEFMGLVTGKRVNSSAIFTGMQKDGHSCGYFASFYACILARKLCNKEDIFASKDALRGLQKIEWWKRVLKNIVVFQTEYLESINLISKLREQTDQVIRAVEATNSNILQSHTADTSKKSLQSFIQSFL